MVTINACVLLYICILLVHWRHNLAQGTVNHNYISDNILLLYRDACDWWCSYEKAKTCSSLWTVEGIVWSIVVSDGLFVCPYVTLGCVNVKLKFINAIAIFKQCHSHRFNTEQLPAVNVVKLKGMLTSSLYVHTHTHTHTHTNIYMLCWVEEVYAACCITVSDFLWWCVSRCRH